MDDKRLERIEDKIDSLVSKVASIDVTLAKQHESIKHHIKRTDLLEAEVKPIKTHVDRVSGAMKFLGLSAMLIGVYEFLKSVI